MSDVDDILALREPDPGDFEDMRESVAAHQAECPCHPADSDACRCDEEAFYGSFSSAQDASGALWHVDELCKARPEAVARMKGGA